MSCHYSSPSQYGTEYKPIDSKFEFFSPTEAFLSQKSSQLVSTNLSHSRKCPSESYSSPAVYGTDYGRRFEFINGQCVKRKSETSIGIL